MAETLVLTLHVLVAAAIIGLVLLQHGRGADMGAAFGSGSSGSLFGAVGSANFLSRATAVLATVFFLSSVALTWFGSQRSAPTGLIQPTTNTAPVSPAGARPSDIPAVPGGGLAAPTDVPATPAAPAGAGAAPSGPADSKAADVPK